MTLYTDKTWCLTWVRVSAAHDRGNLWPLLVYKEHATVRPYRQHSRHARNIQSTLCMDNVLATIIKQLSHMYIVLLTLSKFWVSPKKIFAV